MANPKKKKYSLGEAFKCNNCPETVIATETIIRNHNYRCKKCRNAFVIRYQKANPDKIKQWDKNYQKTESAKLVKKKSTDKYRLANPEKYRAHSIVQSAKRSGKLNRQNCEKCGNKNTHAHHDDYNKPLDVIWLCPVCHKQRHKLLKQLEKQ